jgi:hypothetical protein
MTLSLIQHGNRLSGTASLAGDECFTDVPVTGTVRRNKATLGAAEPQWVSSSGTIFEIGETFKGSLSAKRLSGTMKRACTIDTPSGTTWIIADGGWVDGRWSVVKN